MAPSAPISDVIGSASKTTSTTGVLDTRGDANGAGRVPGNAILATSGCSRKSPGKRTSPGDRNVTKSLTTANRL